jgi:outer membrane protein assembly factor BamB
LPGTGHSSPVVLGDRLWTTAGDEQSGQRTVVCLRTADGGTIWKKSFPAAAYKKHSFNAYAAMTPPVDKDHVYLAWTTPDSFVVTALDQQSGREVWRRDLGTWEGEHGSGASPVLVDDLLVVPNDQDGKSFVVALDRLTGQTRWQIDRRSQKAAYATPCLWQPAGGRPQLILTSQAHGFTALDPRDGSLLWELPIFKHRAVGSPTIAAGLIVAGCGEGGIGRQMMAVAPGDPAAKREPKVAYEFTAPLPYVPIPVAHGNLLFLWGDAGVVTCCDAPSGNVHWRERVGGKYFCSPVRVRDRIYCASRDGEMVVLAAAAEYKLLGRSPLGEGTHATPAVAGNSMYIRTLSHLIAIGGRQAAAAAPPSAAMSGS